MKTKKVLLLLSLAAVLLGGCNEKRDSSSSSKDSSAATETTTSSSLPSSELSTTESSDELYPPEPTTIIDDDTYTISTSWPNSALQAYAATFDLKDTLPNVTLERKIYHAILDWGYDFYFLKVITDDADDLLDIALPFEDAGYDITLDDEYLYALSVHEEIQLYAYYLPANIVEPNRIEIMLFIEEVAEDYLFDYLDEHDGWPSDALASYFALKNSTSTIPSLSDVTVSYTLLIDEDPYFPDPYFLIFIPGSERTLEYKALLENDNFELELDDPDDIYPYYYAYKDAENLELEFGYYESGEGLPAGMHIYITAYTVIEPPANSEQVYRLDFNSTSTLTTATDNLGVWETDALTMTIKKADSTVFVGGDKSNGGYWHSPLRVYADQEVTFSVSGKTIDQIVVTTDPSKGVEGLADGFFYSAVIVNTNGAIITIKPTNNQSEITVTISSQVRFLSLEVYYA
ncbi:MAG TPA: hypothetical protein VFD05_01735 [Bacilli bacterium]|nr:hypothetical protein [Bacilli bacterium]